jgi:hypothetical protein
VFHLLFSVEEGPSYLQKMVICSVFGCDSESGKSTNRKNGIAFHRFPNREKFPKQYAQWTLYCKRKNFNPNTNSRICSKHFRKSDFNESQSMKVKLMSNEEFRLPSLKPGSVPSVNISDITSERCLLSKKLKKIKNPNEEIENSSKKICTSTLTNRQLRHERKERKELVSEILECVFEEPQPGTSSADSAEKYNELCKSVQCELGTEIYRNYNSCNFNVEAKNCFETNTDAVNECNYEPCESEYCDDDYDSDSTSECSEKIETENVFAGEYFFVSRDAILQLLETCLECGAVIKKLNSYAKGSMLCVKLVCECGNKRSWYSQPMVGKRPEGNVLIASSLLLSGILFTPFKSFCNTIKMPMMSRSTFDKIVNNIVGPVKDLWYVERETNLNTLKNSREPIWFCKIHNIFYNGPPFGPHNRF